MRVIFTARAQKTYKKLPLTVKIKTDKKLKLLQTNIKHPSLRVRKMSGTERFEARIDYHYRLTFIIKNFQNALRLYQNFITLKTL